jgi:hypothetical protein
MKKQWMIFATVAAAGWIHAAIQPLDGTNAVGITEIAAPSGANAIITVPFEACLGDGAPGVLSDLVSTYSLTSHSSDPSQADQLIVLTTEGVTQVYYYYYNDTEDGWTSITSAQLMPDGTSKEQTPPAASAFAVARGLGFWIKRVAGTGSSVYVQGQVSSAKQATAIAEGLNLIGYSALKEFSLNSAPGINWTGAYGGDGNTAKADKILVSKEDGSYAEYYYFTKPDSWPVAYDSLHNKWITKSYTLAVESVPAGKGFWYQRRGSGTFTFSPDGE